MGEKSKNILIGLFVISTCIITLWLLLFLRPSYGDKKQVLKIRFASIEKVSVGTKVTFAGKSVGQVKSISYIYDAREQDGIMGRVYFYELGLAIDSRVKVYSSDDIMVRTSGLLGEKIIAIIPKHRVGDETGHLIEKGETIYATAAGPMAVEEALHQVVSLARKMEKSMDQLFSLMENEKLWKDFEEMFSNITEISRTLNQPDTLKTIIDNMKSLSTELYSLEQKFTNSWETIDGAIENFSTTAQNSKEITDQINQLVTNTRKGENTVGKLFTKSDLYLRATSVTDKIDTLMNDINHYGMLFHLDKGWQRMRTKRINILAKLNTPSEFRNYFEDELDQVNTSLSRVADLLSTIKKSPNKKLLEEEGFSANFAELLNRVKHLEDNLSLYNQQFFQEK